MASLSSLRKVLSGKSTARDIEKDGSASEEGSKRGSTGKATMTGDHQQGQQDKKLKQISSNLEDNFSRLRVALHKYEKASTTAQSHVIGPHIQKAPSSFRDNPNMEKYLEPKVFSFGPIQHGKEKLQNGEDIKLRLAALYLKRMKFDEYDYYEQIANQIKDFKHLYANEVASKYASVAQEEALSWMLFVDGCALLFYILHFNSDVGFKLPQRNMKKIERTLLEARDDVFLLENQLPYDVLMLLLSKDGNPEASHRSFSDSFEKNLRSSILWKSNHGIFYKKKPGAPHDVLHRFVLGIGSLSTYEAKRRPHHLLHLLWMRTTGCEEFYPYSNTTLAPSRSVQELTAIGVRLKPNDSTHKLGRISFNKGRFFGPLELEPITLDNPTAIVLANLMAFEKCPGFDNLMEVTSYVCFFNSLVANAQDVSDLRSTGVLYNFLSSDSSAFDMLRELTSDLAPNQDFYTHVKVKIEGYFKHHKARTKINSWLVEVAQVYFRTPWSSIAVLAAAFAIAVNVVQAYFTIFPRQTCRQ